MENSVLARNVLLLGALDEIGAAAACKGLDLLLLKGAALLAEGLWSPAEREMTDLDLLIRPGDEKAFDILLAAAGFKPMENSSQAYYRASGPSAPPVIADIHTGLWHERDTGALWHRSRFLTGSAGAVSHLKGLGFEDQLLHLASHPLLYHGALTPRALEDIVRLLGSVYARTDRGTFWLKASEIARVSGLEAVVHPALRRSMESAPCLISEAEIALFRPRGAGWLKSLLFEKAAAAHSDRLEYILPALYRPGLVFRYMFPGRTFMERRYGSSSPAKRFKRAMHLLSAVLGKKVSG